MLVRSKQPDALVTANVCLFQTGVRRNLIHLDIYLRPLREITPDAFTASTVTDVMATRITDIFIKGLLGEGGIWHHIWHVKERRRKLPNNHIIMGMNKWEIWYHIIIIIYQQTVVDYKNIINLLSELVSNHQNLHFAPAIKMWIILYQKLLSIFLIASVDYIMDTSATSQFSLLSARQVNFRWHSAMREREPQSHNTYPKPGRPNEDFIWIMPSARIAYVL